MNKKIIVAGVILLAIIFLLFAGNGPEDAANEYIEAMYEGKAKKCVSLMSDSLIYQMQEQSGLATKKLLINKLQDGLDGKINSYNKKYGKKWKYDIEIIDSYEKDGMVEVAYKVSIKGKGLFKEKNGKESGTLKFVKSGMKWYLNEL